MKFKVEKYRNEALEESFEFESDSSLDLIKSLAPNQIIMKGSTNHQQEVVSAKIKGSDIVVSISVDGVLFYFSPQGEEIVLDNLDYKWILEPVGAYHSEILKQLDIETLIISPLK